MTETEGALVESRHLDHMVVGFVAALRDAGLTVPVGSTIVFRRSLELVGVDRSLAVYWAGRATLVTCPEDLDVFDAVFDAYWQHRDQPGEQPEPEIEHLTIALDDGADDGEGGEVADEPDVVLRWSPAEVLREKDFALCSNDELEEAQRLMMRMRFATRLRPSHRHEPARHDRGRDDLRRTVREALRTEGEPMRRATTVKRQQPRRLVLLLDVSGSMESYARALLRFIHAAVVARRRVEAFALGTRLTRLTKELSSHDPDQAFRQATGAVVDWSGGTRLGAVLTDFNDQWGVRGMARGAVVVVLSDGWDRGDPGVLGEQMARLHRVAHRVVWVNPLKSTPGYAPLAGGMAAALPHVDEFIEGHNLASLEQLAAVVAA
ncbi:MAG: VWA domain-containing protein [Acidimicrobiia bacterium]|nr:VWA domain-containing protein [Acidimicrobiia bacterium]